MANAAIGEVRVRVFVYGSLRKGMRNAGRMTGTEFVGPAEVPGFRLVDLGAYPAMTPLRPSERPEAPVQGELYDVTAEQLEALDRFEGCPRLYQRVSVQLPDLSTAWAYTMEPERLATSGKPSVPGSDWVKYVGSGSNGKPRVW